MSLTATIYSFDIDLADSDRHVYESLALRVARHPSESEGFLVARVLAYGLEYTEGLAFSRGLSDPDEPALAVRDLTGRLTAWIEIGWPDAARLHRASKAADRVAVYVHKDPANWLRGLHGERIHRADAVHVYALDRQLIAGFCARLERRMAFTMSVAEATVYLSIGTETLSGSVTRHALQRPA